MTTMSHLEAYQKELFEIRFSPMCKPAGEVANFTQLESHMTRARMMMLWQIVKGQITWTPRRVELVYQSTLDSISEAFDMFHYPISDFMLAARADIWEAGLTPHSVKQVVRKNETFSARQPDTSGTMLLAGEVAHLSDESWLTSMQLALARFNGEVSPWVAHSGALAYSLGARDVARSQARRVIKGIEESGATTIIADGPETAWALNKAYPALGLDLPVGIEVKSMSIALHEHFSKKVSGHDGNRQEKVMFHDSRPACLLAERMANHLAIMPGYLEDEAAFGVGAVYEAPRNLIEALGFALVFGTWTRSLSRTSGADDGLWLTYPRLAAGLAVQRLDYAESVVAETIVTDSPLAASYLSKHTNGRSIRVTLLTEFLEGKKQ